ncbi:MAG: hypothetical protein O3A75_06185 [Verrucomicrobia bacterium]|jgi:hypothetical protein|nr:hypothetical protein [Verrucomicrobiota bacterium]MDA1203875.1 hypothetical protein [Verrucomicrobiota bacterium]
MFRRWVLVWVLACGPATAQVAAPELLKPENRTVSNSKQFTVFGGTRGQRSELVRRAEELKTGLQRELQESDRWKTPVLVVLTPGDGVRLRQSPVLLQVFEAGEAGGKIQLDLAPGTVSDAAAVDRGILRALLLERSMRRQKFEGGRFIEPPDWLSSALAASLGREASRDASLYADLMESRSMPRLDRFLRQNAATMKGRARELHAAQSLALYNGLLELPDGRRRIIENLTLAAPAREPEQRFAQTWPELAEDEAKLARLWALAVARLSTPKKLEFFGAEETGKKLRQILGDLDTSNDGVPAADVLVVLSRKEDGRFRIARAAQEMQRLAFRSHPLYAPLVEEYRTLLDDLARNRRRGFVGRFEATEELCLALDDRSREITDHMNWYQVNQVSADETAGTVRMPVVPDSTLRRNDAISRHLDSVERRGW